MYQPLYADLRHAIADRTIINTPYGRAIIRAVPAYPGMNCEVELVDVPARLGYPADRLGWVPADWIHIPYSPPSG